MPKKSTIFGHPEMSSSFRSPDGELHIAKPMTSVILPEALLLRVANALKASNTELALELQEAMALFKKQAPEGYVWSDEFDGGCFVYAYEDHPKDARAVYVLN